MLVAECTLAHIRQFDGSFGAGVHEPIAALRMEFGSSNDFGELFHVCRFNVHNVETLVLNIEIPQIDAEIVTADEGLTIAVDRDAVDVVGMGVGVSTSRDCSNYGVVMGHAGKFEIGGARENVIWS